MKRVVLFLVLWAATASAAPPARVLVADPDPALVHAIDASLAPWQIVVIAEPSVSNEAHAHARADAVDAQFIVWRDGDQLVVFDREHGTSERRSARAGAFDAVSAAAAALTVKTLLRLPPLAPARDADPVDAVSTSAPPAPPAPPAPAGRLRVQAGAGARVARGSQTDGSGRARLAALVRPFATLPLWLGITGEGGTSSTVARAGFKGTWGDWSVLAVASWSWKLRRLELEPAISAGFSRSLLDGESAMVPWSKSATLPVVRAGVSVRWPVGRWSVGASLDADLIFGTPTYTKEVGMSANPVFEVPGFAAVLALFAAADFGL